MDLRNLTKKYERKLGPVVVPYLEQVTGPNTMDRAARLVTAALAVEAVPGLHGRQDDWLETARYFAGGELRTAVESGLLTRADAVPKWRRIQSMLRPDALLMAIAELHRDNVAHQHAQARARYTALLPKLTTADKL